MKSKILSFFQKIADAMEVKCFTYVQRAVDLIKTKRMFLQKTVRALALIVDWMSFVAALVIIIGCGNRLIYTICLAFLALGFLLRGVKNRRIRFDLLRGILWCISILCALFASVLVENNILFIVQQILGRLLFFSCVAVCLLWLVRCFTEKKLMIP